MHHAFLQWLTQGIQHARSKLAELVQKQHPLARQRNLTRSHRRGAATDETHERDGVMRRTERRSGHSPTGRHRHVCRRVHHGARQCLLVGECRQDARQPSSQHRLARTGWPHQQQVVCASSGNFQCMTCNGLTTHVGKVGQVIKHVGVRSGFLAQPARFTTQACHRVGQIRRHHHVTGTCRSSRRGIARSNHYTPITHRANEWRSTHYTAQRPIEAELGYEREFICNVGWELLVGNQHGDGNCQVQARATFPFATRGEVHRDSTIGPGEPARQERGTHSISALTTYFVGLTNDRESG